MEQDEPPPLHPGEFETVDAWFSHGAEALERLLARKRPLVVGVFEDQDVEEVNEIADETGIDLVAHFIFRIPRGVSREEAPAHSGIRSYPRGNAVLVAGHRHPAV